SNGAQGASWSARATLSADGRYVAFFSRAQLHPDDTDFAGDVYLRIRLVPHPLFDVEGHNLIVTVPVAPWEVALGAQVEVPTLTGAIQMRIPAHSQNGQKLRIPGKGLPGKAGPGDLFAVLKVVMPPKTGENVDQLWEQLADKAGFDPRAEWSR
ncbi:MAG: DnaJ C-terminal domain-containing protein, partial [Alcanivoracaceae bacterium]